MSYKPTAWIDHVNSGNIYNINENADGTKEIVYAGEVLQKGTPMSAENFNHMETGIETADRTASAALTAVNVLTPKIENMESDISELQETVQSNADTIGVHENKIAVLSNNVSGIQNGLSATAERVSEVEDELSSHEHSWSEITSKPSTFTPSSHSLTWSSITSKPSSFTPASHNHTWDDISNKTVDVKPYASSTSGFNV